MRNRPTVQLSAGLLAAGVLLSGCLQSGSESSASSTSAATAGTTAPAPTPAPAPVGTSSPAPVPSPSASPTPTPIPTPTPVATPSGPRVAELTLAPTDARIEYSGRWDMSNATPRCNWTGCAFRITTDAAEVRATLIDGRDAGASTWDSRTNSFAVYVDGARTQLITLERNTQREYILASGLAAGAHVIEVKKASQAMRGIVAVAGLRMTNARAPTKPTARARVIEFIGDSITCAAGNIGPASNACNDQENEDASRGFGLMSATDLDAEVSVVCRSGVRAQDPAFLEETGLALGIRDLYGFATIPAQIRAPDAIVVNLGTNDGSPSTGFSSAMSTLLDRLRGRAPNAHIVLMQGPMAVGFGPTFDALVLARGGAAARMHRLDVPFDTTARVGCTGHPNVDHHRDIANSINAKLRGVAGW